MNKWAKRLFIIITMLGVTHAGFCALIFSATDYLSVPDSTSLNITGTGLTINAWLKKLSPANGTDIICKANAGGTTGYQLRSNNATTLRLSLAVSGVGKTLSGSTAGAFDGNWHMVTATYDGTTLRLYTDTVQDATTLTAAGTITSSAGTPLIIGSNITNVNYYGGSMDDVLILPYVLTTAQMQSLFLFQTTHGYNALRGTLAVR